MTVVSYLCESCFSIHKYFDSTFRRKYDEIRVTSYLSTTKRFMRILVEYPQLSVTGSCIDDLSFGRLLVIATRYQYC
jgi:glutaredoxin-related protein